MANVKLTEKTLLEKLQAKLTLLSDHKISQQEILDKCIIFSNQNFQQFVEQEFDSPNISDEKIGLIAANAVNAGYFYADMTDDDLLYGNTPSKKDEGTT